jgi:protocatechuate 4,5-dioxygenase beta chain
VAEIVGAIGTSHVPVLGKAMAKGLQLDPYFRPWFDGLGAVQDWLAEVRPDVAVVFYNDHGLNFFLDKMPTFAIGAAREYRNADEGWGIPTLDPFPGDLDLSWHLVNEVVRRDFDLVICQEMLVDHALKMLWPAGECPVRTVPVCINTVQFPLPSARRCYALGEAIGDAIRSWESDSRVLLIASGGLSHQLEGERAGFINRAFDLEFLDSLTADPRWATKFSPEAIVERAGTQGVELIMWLAARGALGERAREVHRNYHIPISNTAAGLIALAPT